MKSDEFSVVVEGDVTQNWNLATREGAGSEGARATFQAGGAALLRELIAAAAPRPISLHPEAAPQPTSPTDQCSHHRFALWAPQKKMKEGDGGKAWRVEEFLGMQRASAPPPEAEGPEPERADLVVLHDAGLGFRDRPESWPLAIGKPGANPPWVILRTVKPVAKGKLWDHLERFAERTIAVIRIDDLRLGGMHVTRELSWERTAQDLLSELCDNQELRRCAHVVVSFTTAGALVLSRGDDADGQPRCRLVFDPAVMERMWNEAHAGDMIGGVTALVAAISREVIAAPQDPDVVWGVRCGIAAMRALDLGGYDARPDSAGDGLVELEYPRERIARVLAARKPRRKHLPTKRQPFAEAPVHDPHRGGTWSILEDRHPGNLEDLAMEIVRDGHERALREVPRGKFEKLLTFDRTEIEGLQSIRMLIRQYAERERPPRPLSIAVFGPPGSGKSWSVKQVAEGALGGDEVKKITFNLSQFDDPRGLIEGFYQIRDISLGGKLPLVLWDEFDTNRVTKAGQQPLGWLPHFLSPMEDGTFQDGQLTHPIGKAVFAFAGGVYQRMEAFAADSEKLKDAKAPDFVSRLRGYVNVVGPNPRGGDRHGDRYYLIRRAVMVRQLLHRHWPEIFHDERAGGERLQRARLDEGVLRALLLTSTYRHGTRSLGSVIATSVVRGQDHFGRSDLPSEAQLNLHVDADDFLARVHGAEGNGTVPEAGRTGFIQGLGVQPVDRAPREV